METTVHQPTPHETLARLNEVYDVSLHGNSKEGKKSAQQAFYACHDWLRTHQITFHLAPYGRWVRD